MLNSWTAELTDIPLQSIWRPGKSIIRLTSKFVCEVLLCFSKVKLVNEEKFPAAAPFKLADQKRV